MYSIYVRIYINDHQFHLYLATMSKYPANAQYGWSTNVDPMEIVSRILYMSALDRPGIVDCIVYYDNLVLHPPRHPSMTKARHLSVCVFNRRQLDKARAQLTLIDRMHELLRLTQSVRVSARTPPTALAVCNEVWLAELLGVADQYRRVCACNVKKCHVEG